MQDNTVKTATAPITDRTDRNLETREMELREQQWKPAGQFPDPPDIPGFKHRWIRKSLLGEYDSHNVEMREADGWRPVPYDEYVGKMSPMPARRPSGWIEAGDTLLARVPTAYIKQRDEAFHKKAQRQIDAVNRGGDYMSQSRAPNMPLYNDSTSVETVAGKRRTSFGDGS